MAGAGGGAWKAAAAPQAAPDVSNPGLTRAAIESEIRMRAARYLPERFLDVDYYRIRRKLAYPLPVKDLSIPSIPVPGISDYPWSIWMLWALEERIHSLAWAAEWFKDRQCANAASRDLEGLANFPKFRQLRTPDLAAGHAGRLLWMAATKWRWLAEPVRAKIREACKRHVEEVLPESKRYYGELRSKQAFLSSPSPYPKLHNIPLIGTIGAALTASVAGHPEAGLLNEFIQATMETILDVRKRGYTEGVAYDGYILDFIADWLETVAPAQRKPILDHPEFKQFLEQSYMLSAPGAMEQVAELSDVEPKEMPFHYSAQAKLAKFQRDPLRAWYLRRWRPGWIRADALGALHPLVDGLQGAAPAAGQENAHYAVVLRSGWEANDLAVAASCTNSPTGHLQEDNGTVVIGTRGQWIISDPGYQQYMAGLEREFTIGPTAHNCPLINGQMQDKKQPKLAQLDRVGPDLLRASIDLTACYPAKANLTSVVRHIWLAGHDCVVIADQVKGERIESVRYHWHGHPDAAWWVENGWALLHLAGAALWFTSPQAQLADSKIQRLPGSRGQLTLVTEADPNAPAIWWAFALAGAHPELKPSENGRAIELLGKRFRL